MKRTHHNTSRWSHSQCPESHIYIYIYMSGSTIYIYPTIFWDIYIYNTIYKYISQKIVGYMDIVDLLPSATHWFFLKLVRGSSTGPTTLDSLKASKVVPFTNMINALTAMRRLHSHSTTTALESSTSLRRGKEKNSVCPNLLCQPCISKYTLL